VLAGVREYIQEGMTGILVLMGLCIAYNCLKIFRCHYGQMIKTSAQWAIVAVRWEISISRF